MAKMTTLCYIEHDGKYLMLYRNKKENDINHGKWIGVGGHFEGTESPEECLVREVKEETGLTIFSYQFRGIITFVPKPGVVEYMCLYTADGYRGELIECDEGELKWVKKSAIEDLNLWEGDRLFMELLRDEVPFFSLKLEYDGDRLKGAALNGMKLAEEKKEKIKNWRLPWAK
ncbi:8-oxo-dGTP diphosphatase [Clostridium sp. AM58-1XD]|uniref:NUDIX hydrolase n=1 Tax=Clostridium sp. AM58-1XD TaxID=2292307 RepID=UPI000E4B5964|nr:8-oxo-dGTP diphosphatase [Clostridium sp. AM58-1XD]RGZ00402.1 8-oxo-dGTP diphosphatase [Clostridium sp. AM58-1XD]